MKRRSEADFDWSAAALPAFWGANGDFAERAYRAWLEAAGEIQRETVAFINNRLAKDSAAFAGLGQCTTTGELWTLQAEYTRDALADFLDEGRKMAAWVGDAAVRGLALEPGDKPAARTATARTTRRNH